MKFLPLVWAALTRKPARAVLTLLAVTMAFTVFGLMIGLSATIDGVAAQARGDRMFSVPRFSYDDGLPVAVVSRIAGTPGVRLIAYQSYIPGYVQNEKNHLFLSMGSAEMARVYPDWLASPAMWERVRHDRTGIIMSRLQADRWHKKV